MTSVQNVVTPAQIQTVIAFLVYVETLVAAVFATVANVILMQTLTQKVSILAPSLSSDEAQKRCGLWCLPAAQD